MKKLGRYAAKRDFTITSEPPAVVPSGAGHAFVVQKHAARRLHYDFRLELDGVLKSWAVPKGPSLSPREKRLAVEVEDHPVDYRDFEGNIPEGQYGGGEVIVWDRGTWAPVGDPVEGLRKGHLRFELASEKLAGGWSLVRIGSRGGEKRVNWLLIKARDEHAREGADAEITAKMPGSVLTGRSVEDLAEAPASEKIVKKGAKKGAKKRKKSDEEAEPAAVVEQFEPQLATLVDHVPTDPGWLFEMKLDGYRAIALVEGGKARLISRNGLDWTARFSDIAAALGHLRVKNAVLDGEVCFVDDEGKTSFQGLQNALSEEDQSGLVYFAFDLLHRDGDDLRALPLRERKRILATILAGERAPLSLSEHLEDVGTAMFEEASRLGLEGIIAKRADAPYTAGRTRSWLKIKAGKRQELVVIGYTAPTGKRTGIGALVLGVHGPGKKGALRFVGKVGTGFDAKMLTALRRRLEPLARATPPVADPPRVARVTWVEPEIVVEIGFTEWTTDGALRHPTFLGLREDKPSEDVVREEPASLAAPRAPRAAARTSTRTRRGVAKESAVVAGVTITHEGRVLDTVSGVTKGDLARYYAAVARELLPHAKDRPLSIVRCTSGIGKACFFQKSAMPGMGDSVHRHRVGEHEVLSVTTATGLLQIVQLGGIELHTWGSKLPATDRPDRIVFDLDPDEGLPYGRVVEAALEAREILASIGLEAWLKTTGGKGLHVVVPFRPKHGWGVIRGFARAVAEDFARRAPKAFTATAAKAARKGRIFVDYLRNGEGATAVVPYSARARAGLTVAMPIAWEDVRRVHPRDFTVQTVPDLLARRKIDPWAELRASKQRLPDDLDEMLDKAR
jgi:bifunctional non-homologous end joining protein LigD